MCVCVCVCVRGGAKHFNGHHGGWGGGGGGEDTRNPALPPSQQGSEIA